jgi:hypothetical protein
MESLIQRLNEVTARLIAEEKALQRDDSTLLACHGQLDGLEALVFGGLERSRDRTPHHRASGDSDHSGAAATIPTIPAPDRSNNGGDRRECNYQPRVPPHPSPPEQTPIGHGEALSASQQQALLRRISKAAQGLRNRHEELKVRARIPNYGLVRMVDFRKARPRSGHHTSRARRPADSVT